MTNGNNEQMLLILPWVVIYMHDNNRSTSVGPAPPAWGCPGHRFYFGDSRDQNPNSVNRLLTLLLAVFQGSLIHSFSRRTLQ